LYREHLSNVYRALGQAPPENLSESILREHPGEIRSRPQNPLSVNVDGEVSTPYEWLGAGHYRPDTRSGAMDGGHKVARELYFGTDESRLFVRLDGAGSGVYGIEFESGTVAVRAVRGRVVEIEAPKAGPRFRVTVRREGLPEQRLPAEGWLEL
jgi:hypothetical protein